MRIGRRRKGVKECRAESIRRYLGQPAEAILFLHRSLEWSHPGDSIVRKLYALLVDCDRSLGRTDQALSTCAEGLKPKRAASSFLFLLSFPMEARFRIAVQNAVRNLLRTRRRRQPMTRAIGIGPAVGEVPAHAIPDRRHDDLDDEMLTAFRDYLADEMGDDAVTLLDRRLDGVSLRQLVGSPTFSRSPAWALRRLMANVRDAALEYARQHGDDEFLTAIERLMGG